MTNLNDTIESLEELIQLSMKKITLLKELKRNLMLAERFGVNPNDIERFGYDPSADFRHRFGVYVRTQYLDDDLKQPNYVILKDGTRINKIDSWDNSEDRRQYLKWRFEELEKFRKGEYLFRPDVSPSEWKRQLKNRPLDEAGN